MTRNRPVTRSDVEQIVGKLDDTQIAEIIATKATVAELVEASQWVLTNDTPGIHRHKSPRVNRLCEIIDSARPDDDVE
ncbi:hypothetical protein SAMN05216241_11119 [Limimonas halophila]|uniref:Uncharacterized protein n=1 Tax=Limimonas halophila TaxID=1082479 RepID=A0A1G7TZD4_9PROT|nr:hypothetical protein [Limimonas halophila]SDG40765.1 hypothetical protein SAMN05216241_11119 [Limimonas halophila]